MHMQLGKFFNRNWVVLSIIMIVVGAGAGSFAATFEYGINPTNNRPNANIGQGYISTSVSSRLYNYTENDFWNACNETAISGGVVTLPNGNLTLSKTIYIKNMTTVIGQGRSTILYLSTNDAGINITSLDNSNERETGRLQNVYIETKGGYTGTAITVYASDSSNIQRIENVLSDIYIENTGSGADKQTGTAVLLKAIGSNIGFCTFGDIVVHGFEYGMYLWSVESGNAAKNSWINANEFDSYVGIHCAHMLRLFAPNTVGVDGTSQCSGNNFKSVIMQCVNSDGARTLEGINITGNCNVNNFAFVDCWDWTNVPTAMQVNISPATGQNYTLSNKFTGRFYSTNINSGKEYVNSLPNLVAFIGARFTNNGSCIIPSGSDSVVVDHHTYVRKQNDAQDNSVKPVIMINPGENITDCDLGSWWVDTVTHTQFTLHVDNKATSDCTFYWMASLDYYTYY